MFFYFYVLKSLKDGKLYSGFTGDLKERVKKHNSGYIKSTAERKPFKLVYYEAYRSEYEARRREYQIKRRAGALISLKRRIKKSIDFE